MSNTVTISTPTLLSSAHHHPLPSLPATTSPPRAYAPRLTKLSPAEFFSKSLHQAQRRPHDPPPENVKNDPRTARLLRKPYPDNLVRDNKVPTDLTRTGLATPLLASQKECGDGHARWHESNNFISPVECGICLCAGDCLTDTALFFQCGSCALRVCTECKGSHDAGGMRACMARYKDGSRTAEARGQSRKGKENARSGRDSGYGRGR